MIKNVMVAFSNAWVTTIESAYFLSDLPRKNAFEMFAKRNKSLHKVRFLLRSLRDNEDDVISEIVTEIVECFLQDPSLWNLEIEGRAMNAPGNPTEGVESLLHVKYRHRRVEVSVFGVFY